MSGSCGDGCTCGVESCDDGNASTESCQYGALDCTVYGETCDFVPGEIRRCGDGVTDPEEAWLHSMTMHAWTLVNGRNAVMGFYRSGRDSDDGDIEGDYGELNGRCAASAAIRAWCTRGGGRSTRKKSAMMVT